MKLTPSAVVQQRCKPDTLPTIVETSRPCALLGLLEGWPAVKRWTCDYLSTTFGSLEVTCKVIRERNDWFRPRQEFTTMSLAEALKTFAQAREQWPQYYVTKPTKHLAPMLSDLPIPDFVTKQLAPNDLLRSQLFVGNSGISKCHYHTFERALLCQVMGQKEVLLFPPQDTQYLYPYPWYDVEHNWSFVNFFELNDYPEILRATAYKTILEPGDTLYIPPGWWHATFGVGISTSVTYFWGDPKQPTKYIVNYRQGLRDLFEWYVRRPIRQRQLQGRIPKWVSK